MRAPTSLTPHQQQAVAYDAPRVLLVASAGSGKTEVLTRRVVRHLEGSPGETFRILAVTFTVRAAQELKARLQASVSSEAWRVDADTVHGFALDWLMRFGQCVNVFPDTVVYSDDVDRLLLLENYVQSLGESADADLRGVLRAIDQSRTIPRDDGQDQRGPSVGSIPFADLFDGYVTALDAANGIDFAGMLTKFLDAAKEDLGFLENFWATYRHVLVDEGQDLSAAQCDVIDRLAKPPVDLFVVADDRQSINGFAGGGFVNVRELVGDRAFSASLELPHNFRCAMTVLTAAERVATNLMDPPPSALAVEHAPRGAARLVQAPTPEAESAVISRWVQDLLETGLDPSNLADGEDPAVSAEGIAVVARARWVLDPIVDALGRFDIGISIQTDSQSLLKTPAGRVLVDGISVVVSREDAPALRRVVDELSGLGLDVDRQGADMFATIQRSGLTDLVGVSTMLDGLTIENIEERIDTLRNEASDSDLVTDMNTLSVLWTNYAVAVTRNRRDLLGFVRHVARAQQTRPSDPGVRVLTIHKVKGLEFKAVALAGAYNGVLPDYRATSETAIDEERRAFYVAMTRASRELLVTYPRNTTDRYGRTHRQQPSIFAVEAALA